MSPLGTDSPHTATATPEGHWQYPKIKICFLISPFYVFFFTPLPIVTARKRRSRHREQRGNHRRISGTQRSALLTCPQLVRFAVCCIFQFHLFFFFIPSPSLLSLSLFISRDAFFAPRSKSFSEAPDSPPRDPAAVGAAAASSLLVRLFFFLTVYLCLYSLFLPTSISFSCDFFYAAFSPVRGVSHRQFQLWTLPQPERKTPTCDHGLCGGFCACPIGRSEALQAAVCLRGRNCPIAFPLDECPLSVDALVPRHT